jgi:hypothetical protein
VTLGQRHVERVGPQPHQLDPLGRIVERRHDHGGVELAAGHGPDGLGGLGPRQRHRDRRLAASQSGHDLGDEGGARRREGAQAQRRVGPVDQLPHLGLTVVDGGEDAIGVPEHPRARGGGGDGPVVGPVDQDRPDGPLERGDVLGHRRLGVAERLGRAAERALPGHLAQRTQPPGIEHPELLITSMTNNRWC